MNKTALLITLTLFSSFAVAGDFLIPLAEDKTLEEALEIFHEPMAELHHGPLEDGDIAPLRSRAEEFEVHIKKIMKANLSPIYSPRREEISGKIMDLKREVDSLVKAAREKSDDKVLKAAFDRMHDAYRELRKCLISPEKIIQRIHDEIIHPLWHESYPKRDIEAMKKDLPLLKIWSKLLKEAAKALKMDRVAKSAQEFEEMVVTTQETFETGNRELILEAVKLLHNAYHNLEDSLQK